MPTWIRSLVVACLVMVVWGCGGSTEPTPPPAAPAGPVIVIPPGVHSIRTAQQVAQMMLTEIAANERKLGRVLAPARIIRIQLLAAGEQYELRHLDGNNPDGQAIGPSDGPGWVVEAIGTFPEYDWRHGGQLSGLGIHGFHEWDDGGGEAIGQYLCWTPKPMDAADRDGECR